VSILDFGFWILDCGKPGRSDAALAATSSNPKSKIQNPKSRRRGGFTLFEVLVSIAIFMLLAGGIFASVRAAFIASTQVVSDQLDSERLDSFQQFLRKLFLSLPADARVELKLRQQPGLGDVVEVRLWPVPGFLQFGTNSSDGAAVSAQPDGKGGFRVMLGYFRADDSPDQREARLEKDSAWLMLLPGVKQIRWRFAPARNPVFSETWNEPSGRPGLAELTLEMNGGATSVSQFWIPPLQRRSSTSGEAGAPQQPPNSPQPHNPPMPEGGMP
jgi:type II secretory pathway pseudopilin PulG